jgi:hypothetical protein
MNVHWHFLEVVSSPPGVVQTVLDPGRLLIRNFCACWLAIMLPDAPVSSRHLSVTGLALPKRELNLTYAKGRTSFVLAFLLLLLSLFG